LVGVYLVYSGTSLSTDDVGPVLKNQKQG